jgi:hypothetical protein
MVIVVVVVVCGSDILMMTMMILSFQMFIYIYIYVYIPIVDWDGCWEENQWNDGRRITITTTTTTLPLTPNNSVPYPKTWISGWLDDFTYPDVTPWVSDWDTTT